MWNTYNGKDERYEEYAISKTNGRIEPQNKSS